METGSRLLLYILWEVQRQKSNIHLVISHCVLFNSWSLMSKPLPKRAVTTWQIGEFFWFMYFYNRTALSSSWLHDGYYLRKTQLYQELIANCTAHSLTGERNKGVPYRFVIRWHHGRVTRLLPERFSHPPQVFILLLQPLQLGQDLGELPAGALWVFAVPH